MKIIIENNQSFIELDDKFERVIRDAVNEVLEYECFSKDVEISITLVDNSQIKEINNEYRGKDAATDVLSFPMLNFEEKDTGSQDIFSGDYNYDEDLLILGDIVLSLQRAQEQSREYNHSFEREIGFLTVHSMFHLLGYDHEQEHDASIMRTKEEQVLNRLGLKRE